MPSPSAPVGEVAAEHRELAELDLAARVRVVLAEQVRDLARVRVHVRRVGRVARAGEAQPVEQLGRRHGARAVRVERVEEHRAVLLHRGLDRLERALDAPTAACACAPCTLPMLLRADVSALELVEARLVLPAHRRGVVRARERGGRAHRARLAARALAHRAQARGALLRLGLEPLGVDEPVVRATSRARSARAQLARAERVDLLVGRDVGEHEVLVHDRAASTAASSRRPRWPRASRARSARRARASRSPARRVADRVRGRRRRERRGDVLGPERALVRARSPPTRARRKRRAHRLLTAGLRAGRRRVLQCEFAGALVRVVITGAVAMSPGSHRRITSIAHASTGRPGSRPSARSAGRACRSAPRSRRGSRRPST